MARRNALALAVSTVCAGLVTASVQAATFTWTQANGSASPGTTYNWSDPGNWSASTGAPPIGGAADAVIQLRTADIPDNSGVVYVNAFNDLGLPEFAVNQISLGNNKWGGSGNDLRVNVQGATLAMYGSDAAIAFNTNYGVTYYLQSDIHFTAGSTTTISGTGTNPQMNMSGAWLGSGSVIVNAPTTSYVFQRPYNAASNFTGAITLNQGIFRIADSADLQVQSIPLGSEFIMGPSTTLRFYRSQAATQTNTYNVGTNLVASSGGTINFARAGGQGNSDYFMGTLDLGTDGESSTLRITATDYHWNAPHVTFTSTTIRGDVTIDVNSVRTPGGQDNIVSLGPTTLAHNSSLTLYQWHHASNSWQGSYIVSGPMTLEGDATVTIADFGATASGSRAWTVPQLIGDGTFTLRNLSTLSTGITASPDFTGTFVLEAGYIDDRVANNRQNPGLQTNLVIGPGATYVLWRQLGLGDNADNTVTVNGGTFKLNQDQTVSYAPAYIPQTVYLNDGTIATDHQGNNHGYAARVGGLSIEGDSVANVIGYLITPTIFGSGTLTKIGPVGTLQEQGTFCISGASPMFDGTIVVQEGVLRLDNPDSLGQGSLVIESTGLVYLAFAGVETISSLTIDGVTYTNGTFGSLESSAEFKSAYFTGTGIIAVPEPTVLGAGIIVSVGLLARRRHSR